MNEYIRALSEIDSSKVGTVGGKAASLGEMIGAGLPVPAGFVVTTNAFEDFLKEADLLQEIRSELNGVNREAIHTVEKASQNIQELMLNQSIPEVIVQEVNAGFKNLNSINVAIRSSATAEDGKEHSWAGQLDSYLNVSEEGLISGIQRCWASLFTPRAIFYRFEKGLHDSHVSVAVVVQEMVQSEKSGIAFSVHPVTEESNQIVIEAGFGLGEAIVSGQIIPDSYVISKADNKIIDTNINKQTKALYGKEWKELGGKGEEQVLNKDDIAELSKLIIKIENHYGCPQDIEWAYADGQFFITQSRPITTLKNNSSSSSDNKHSPHPDEYVRMFAGKAFSYLLTDIFLVYYNKWGVASVQDEISWMSLLPKSSQEQTLKEGRELYTSREKYDSYNADFHEYIKESTKYFESILKREESLSSQEVEKYIGYAAKHFNYYSKTEFFYTDLLTEDSMVLTIKEFDKLKLDGRAHLNRLIFKGDGYVRSLVKRIVSQTSANEDDLYFYSINELVQLVDDGIQPEAEIVNGRKKGFFVSKDTLLVGAESTELVHKFFSVYRDVSDVIHGTTANGGKVIGRARVLIPDANDFNKITEEVEKMEQGEVLVAETTAPEIIQACKKASAIITNQGGMLSHAAIISRELNIPCIVGTDKDVVLSIKNGDLLDVDADQGIVRIVNE